MAGILIPKEVLITALVALEEIEIEKLIEAEAVPAQSQIIHPVVLAQIFVKKSREVFL